MSPDVEKQKTPENITDDLVQQEKEKVVDNTKQELGNFLEGFLESKFGKDDPRIDLVTNKIKNLKKVGLGLQLKGAINSVLGFFNIAKTFNPNIQAPTNLIDMQSKTEEMGDKIDEIEGKISKITSGEILTQAQNGVTNEIDAGKLTGDTVIDSALQDLDTKSTALKKQKGITAGAYKAGFATLLQKFMIAVKTGTVTELPKKTDVVPPVVAGNEMVNTTLDINDKKISDRVEQVKKASLELDTKFKDLHGKGNFERSTLSLLDPREKSIIIDPRTQTLYYFEKGITKKIIQVGLGKGNGGDVSAVNESFSTPPGILTIYSDKINKMSDGRPSLLVDGLEESNRNTDTREILIHPTGVPGGKTIDKPTSKGCITMDTELWNFCKDNFAQGIMINVINDKFDGTETSYFKDKVAGKVLDLNMNTQQDIAA